MINNINPIILQWHFLSIRWYGLFLVVGIFLSVLLLVKLFKEKKLETNPALDLSIWLIIGGLIGARLGHVIFYNLKYFLSHPLEIFFIQQGGLSSHGLAIGLLLSFCLFVKMRKIPWKRLVDLIIIPIPLLAFFIRIGNFFNSEIVGRPTNLPLGVKFPLFELKPVFRHPSQIYEALLALLIFFIIYFTFKKYNSKPFFVFNLFLLIYFSSRFLIEFVKEYHILTSGLTMGQWLSIPFILWGVFWFIKRKEGEPTCVDSPSGV